MTRYSQVAALACVLTAALPLMAFAQAPEVGQSQHQTVITIAMQVGSLSSETRRVVYAPPPGWYIRGHAVNCTKRSGNTSYTVNTVPQDWSYVTEEKAHEAFRLLLDLAVNAGLRMMAAAEQEQLLAEVRKVRSTRHALVVDATVRGGGFLRVGGTLELTVTAELVYVGTEDGLAPADSHHQETLQLRNLATLVAPTMKR